MSSQADADDLVSETCLRVLEKQSQFKKDMSLIAWAIRICRNINIDTSRLKSNKNASLTFVVDQPDPMSVRSIESSVEYEEVHRFILTLPLEQREVLVLKGGGFSYDEIAERLDIPRGTVMSRLHRGRIALAKLMDEKVAI